MIRRALVRSLVVAASLAAAGAPARAQLAVTKDASDPYRGARREDVESIAAIVRTYHALLSGPVNAPRDVDRFQSLFWDDDVSRIVGFPLDTSSTGPGVWSPNDFIVAFQYKLPARGYAAVETVRRSEFYLTSATSFSSYEWSVAGQPPRRAFTSFALWSDDNRWYIVTAVTEPASDERAVPEKYLKP